MWVWFLPRVPMGHLVGQPAVVDAIVDEVSQDRGIFFSSCLVIFAICLKSRRPSPARPFSCRPHPAPIHLIVVPLQTFLCIVLQSLRHDDRLHAGFSAVPKAPCQAAVPMWGLHPSYEILLLFVHSSSIDYFPPFGQSHHVSLLAVLRGGKAHPNDFDGIPSSKPANRKAGFLPNICRPSFSPSKRPVCGTERDMRPARWATRSSRNVTQALVDPSRCHEFCGHRADQYRLRPC